MTDKFTRKEAEALREELNRLVDFLHSRKRLPTTKDAALTIYNALMQEYSLSVFDDEETPPKAPKESKK